MSTAPQMEAPPLAQYRDLSTYSPSYGDYFVWSGWFTTWHGIVRSYNKDKEEVEIIFAGVPFILLTLQPDELDSETRKFKLSDIRTASKGKYAVQQHDHAANATIWYI